MGIWKRLSVNRPSNHRVVLFAYIPFSPVSLLSFSLDSPSSLFPRKRASPLSFLPPWSFLGGSTVLHLRRRYIPPCPLRCTRILAYKPTCMYTHACTRACTHRSGAAAAARCCEEDTYVHPDWRFSYLIVDCHAKARTSYWLGVLLLHPLVLGARVCLSVLERRGNKRGESRTWLCSSLPSSRRKRDEKNAGTNLGTARMEMPCRCYSHLHSDFRYKPLFLRLLYIFLFFRVAALPSSCFSLFLSACFWGFFVTSVSIDDWDSFV